jgi:hypothetical protein
VLVALALAACGGGGGGSDGTSSSSSGSMSSSGTGTDRQVVVVGYTHDYTTGKNLGRMWVNGVEKALPVGSSGESITTAAAFIGDKPVASGYYPFHTGPNKLDDQAMLWHNGEIEQALMQPTGTTEGDHQAFAVHVTATDVHVVGVREGVYRTPTYWKNGVAQYLGEEDSYRWATGVAVNDEGVVYISGVDGVVATYPVYWRNGVMTQLGTTIGSALGVATRGYDVYISGSVRNSTMNYHDAAVWKNGALQRLSDGTTAAVGRAVATGGYDDVYVAGAANANSTDYSYAKLWKNGVEQPLEGATAGSDAYAVKVVGSDVYVAGHVYPNDGKTRQRAALWVNGKLNILPANTHNLSMVWATGLAVR